MHQPRTTTLVVAGLVLLSLANLVYAQVFEHEDLRPIERQVSDEFHQLVLDVRETAQLRSALYAQLREVAAGAELVTFPDSGLHPGDALGLSRVALRVDESYDPVISDELFAWLADRPHVSGRFLVSDIEQDHVLIRPAPSTTSTTFVVLTDGERLVIVDEVTMAEATADLDR